MEKLRWDPYVLIKSHKLIEFWKEYYCEKNNKKVLFILGKGFDIRMNFVITEILSSTKFINLDCLLLEYNEGKQSSRNKYNSKISDNILELETLLNKSNKNLKFLKYDLWKNSGRSKRRIGDRDISKKIYEYDISEYTDIIVDISSLQRGIYFSLIGTLLEKIDLNSNLKNKNLFITVAENSDIDKKILKEGIEDNIKSLHGFSGRIEKESNENPLIFIPILGEKKTNDLSKINNQLIPQEICPALPFPSKNPRRSDSLIQEYHQILFDELRVESQNIIYVPEQNPFEAYRILSETILNYNKSLNILGGCNIAITSFSSKLLSIGVLLTAYEKRKKGVGVFNTEAQDYKVENDDFEILKELNKTSETFLMWLNGEAYEK